MQSSDEYCHVKPWRLNLSETKKGIWTKYVSVAERIASLKMTHVCNKRNPLETGIGK